MQYKINFDKIPDALSSEPLRCFLCQAMRKFMQELGPNREAVVDSVSQCCVYMTILLAFDVDITSEDAIETFMLERYKSATPAEVGIPTADQARYLLDVTEKIIDSAGECLIKKPNERR